MRETRFLSACRGEAVDTTPIWLMRQAGRYLPEYRSLRAKHDFLTLCRTPELAVEATLQPVRRFAVDAAILFSDILVVYEGLGIPLAFSEGTGPLVDPPIRDDAAVAKLRPFEPERDVPYVLEAIGLLRRELAGRVPLIGFAGAPFTLACYAVEGRGSKSYSTIKAMAFGAPRTYHALMGKLADAVARYLAAQVAAGAQALQLFDTWAGVWAPSDYARLVAPYTRQVLDGLRARVESVPLIHYVNGVGPLLAELGKLPVDVFGVDWHTPLGAAIDALGAARVYQGNLEPALLYASADKLERRATEGVTAGRRARGHVFNLGHGIHPDVDPDRVHQLVEAVHRAGRRE